MEYVFPNPEELPLPAENEEASDTESSLSGRETSIISGTSM
jgi:hypothetical protein